MERLDRVFVNQDWRILFLKARLDNLPIMRSNHGPMLLDTIYDIGIKKSRGKVAFEAFWTKDDAEKQIIQRVWNFMYHHQLHPMANLSTKLQTCLMHLKAWSQNSYGNLDRKIRHLTSIVSDV